VPSVASPCTRSTGDELASHNITIFPSPALRSCLLRKNLEVRQPLANPVLPILP